LSLPRSCPNGKAWFTKVFYTEVQNNNSMIITTLLLDLISIRILNDLQGEFSYLCTYYTYITCNYKNLNVLGN
jgi:hypothetical protein